MLLLFATLLLSAAATAPSAAAGPVRDTDGRPLLPNTAYYVLPVIRGGGGGLGLATRNGSCPLYVVQERVELFDGLPVKFLPANPDSKTVQVSQDINVQVSAATMCDESMVWTLAGGGPAAYVASNGVAGNPGASTLRNWFRIDRADGTGAKRGYKFVFCPTVCRSCRPVCGDMGLFSEAGNMWLGLRGSSLPVMFKRQ